MARIQIVINNLVMGECKENDADELWYLAQRGSGDITLGMCEDFVSSQKRNCQFHLENTIEFRRVGRGIVEKFVRVFKDGIDKEQVKHEAYLDRLKEFVDEQRLHGVTYSQLVQWFAYEGLDSEELEELMQELDVRDSWQRRRA